jgi:riboflavin-specific deaminase-like protein
MMLLGSRSTLCFIATASIHFLVTTMTKSAFASQGISDRFASQSTMSTVQRITSEVNHQRTAKSLTRTNINPKERPPSLYVCVTYAQTLDGCIAITSTNNKQDTAVGIGSSSNLKLSSPESFLLTHALRANFDAIIVGGNTLSTDNPRLNNRLWNGNDGQQESNDATLKQPIPVILDSNLRHVMSMVESNQIINCAKSHEFIIICCRKSAYEHYSKKIKQYCNVHNVSIKLQVCDCIEDSKRLSLKHVLQRLGENHRIESVMVEGGASIISSFLDQHADLVDCVCVTICPRFVGSKGLNALKSALITGCEGDGMLEFKSSNWFQLGQDSIFVAF